MPEGIISASNPSPPPDPDEQARFDAALSDLLDDQFPRDDSHAPVEHPPGFAPDGPAAEPESPEPAEPAPAATPPPSAPDEVEAQPEPQPEPAPAGGPTEFTPPAAPTSGEPEASSPEPEPAPTETPTDLHRIFEAYLGAIPSAEDTIALLNFVTELQSLPAEHQAVVERALRRDPSLLQSPAAPAQTPPTSAPPSRSRGQSRDTGDQWDDDDDTPDPKIAALEARLAAIESERQAAERQTYERWVSYERESTKNAAAHYAASNQMDANDLAILEAKVHQLGNYPSLLRTHGNDPGAAYAAALDVAYWATPTFRDAAIARAAANQAHQVARDDDRKTLASAVSASSAAAAQPIASDARPSTITEAKQAARAELAALFDAG